MGLKNIDQDVIDKAYKARFKDFENSAQNFCAKESGNTMTITQNTKDYKESELSILTPKEYLAKIKNE